MQFIDLAKRIIQSVGVITSMLWMSECACNRSTVKTTPVPAEPSLSTEEERDKAVSAEWSATSTRDINNNTPPSLAPEGGPRGISNVGNTCYMNAVLQVIAALYADKVPDSPLQEMIAKINAPERECISSKEVDDLKKELVKLSEKESVLEKMIRSTEQHDPHEFFQLLNEKLLFLEQCISGGVNGYVLEFHPTNWNNSFSDMIKEANPTFINFSDKLYVRIDRTDPQKSTKIDDNITETKTITIKSDKNDTDYTLSGFIVHKGGSMQGGHYVAYVKKGGQWYLSDDSNVTRKEETAAIKASEKAYLFFYTK